MDDFNPFDLSSPPKKLEEPLHPEVAARPKATVKRVSMGPIFHSRITKVLALVGGIILAALIGYSAMNYYLNKKDAANIHPSATITNAQTQKTANNSSATVGDKTKETTAGSSEASPTTSSSPSTSAPSSSPTTQPKIYCGVSGMPEGVCTAITSVEKDGLKDNKYVSADTSQVPASTTVQVDEASWKAVATDNNTVSFSAVMNGTNYKGVATLKPVDGIWKVVSYTLS